jgi:hypothetical protein
MAKHDKNGQAQEVLPASVTDYNSSDEEEMPETRKQANVALKRSKDFSASPNLTPQASTINPSSYTHVESSTDSTIRGARQNPDAASDSGYSNRTMTTAASMDSATAGLDDEFLPKMANLDISSLNMSVGAGSDIHTVTTASSTCDREENSSEVFVKNGKRFVLCRNPNCKKKHRAPGEKEERKVKRSDSQAGSSRQSEASRGSGSPAKTKKSVKLPPKEEKDKRRREPSPKRRETERERPKESKKATVDDRPQMRQRSVSVSDPTRPRSGYYEYPIQQPMNHPPNSFFTRYSQGRGQMMVHRSYPSQVEGHPIRPGIQQRATEMSARQIKPGASYAGRAPPLVRQDAPQAVISARKVSRDSQIAHSPFESEEDEEYSTDEDEEDEPEPSLRDYERVIASQRAAQEQKRRDLAMALAMRQQRERELRDDRDKMSMPPPPRPTSAMKVGSTNNVPTYSMRVTRDQLPPLQTRDHLSHMHSPVLTQSSAPVMTKEELMLKQYRQLEAASARPQINPLIGGKLSSTPVMGSDSGSMYAEASGVRQQRRPTSFYGSEVDEWDMQQYQLMDQAHREGLRQQQEVQAAQVAAFERDRIRMEHMRAREMESMGYPVQHPHPMYDSEAMRAEYHRINMNADAATRAEAKIRDAQRHMASTSSNPHAEEPLEGILRKSSHSKRPSKDTSSVSVPDSVRRRRQSITSNTTSNRNTESTITAGTATEGSHVFRTRFDPERDFEFEIEDRVVSLRPNEDGKVELYVGGKREKKYIKSTGTTTSASTGMSARRNSRREPERRARFEDEEEEESEEETEDEELVKMEEKRHRILIARERERQLQARERERDAKGSRRRAETSSASHSGSSAHVENDRGTRPRAKTSDTGSGTSRESRRSDVKRRG